MADKAKGARRSAAWFSGIDRNTFIHRSWMKNQGHPDHVFDGRPIIAPPALLAETAPRP